MDVETGGRFPGDVALADPAPRPSMVPRVVPMSEEVVGGFDMFEPIHDSEATAERIVWIEQFIKAQGEFPLIGKDTTVSMGTYAYSYATLPDIIRKLGGTLRNYGFVVTQSVGGDGNVVTVETRIYHKAGHVETFGPLALRVQGDAKAAGSAITYARRYALCAALGIAPDEDDDGAKASEPAALTGRQWLWNESAVFKAWSEDERKEALRAAVQYLGYGADEALNMDQATAVLNHVAEVYEKRPLPDQEALPV